MRGENLKQQLDKVAQHYDECTFWVKYVQKCGEMIQDKVRGKTILEMGCSRLIVSKMLAKVAKSFEIVEGSNIFFEYAQNILVMKLLFTIHCLKTSNHYINTKRLFSQTLYIIW